MNPCCRQSWSHRILIFLILWCHSTFGFQQRDNILPNSAKDSIELLLQIADSLKTNDNDHRAELIYTKAHNLAIQGGNQKHIFETNRALHRFYSENYAFDNAIAHFKASYLLSKEKQDSMTMARCQFELGLFNRLKSEYVPAMEYFNQAKKLAQHYNDTLFLWSMDLEKGLVYHMLGDSIKARDLYKKSIRLLSNKKFLREARMTYLNLASTFEEPDSIMFYSNKGLKDCSSLQFPCEYLLINLAWAHSKKGEPKKSFQIINDNFNLDEYKSDPTNNLYEGLMHTVGNNYYLMGRYDEAIPYFLLSIEVSKKKPNNHDYQILGNKHLAECYEQLGNYAESTHLLKKVIEISEDYDKIKLKKELANIESLNILEQKEEEITSLQEANVAVGKRASVSRRYNYLLGLVALLLIVASGIFYYRNKIKLYQIKEELSISRLQSLRSVMNPHFLFNSFSILQYFILKKETVKANSYMTQLSGLIRNVMATTESMYISFNKEIELINSYINLEQGRFEQEFDVVYQIDDWLKQLNPHIPSMIIQPYVENAITHGFIKKNKKYSLELCFKKEGDTIKCIVKDNGIGRIQSEAMKKSNGSKRHLSVATKKTRARLKLMNRISKGPATVTTNDLYSKEGVALGTEVVIVLPFNTTAK